LENVLVKKKFRLRSSQDIKRVRNTGKSIANPNLVIVYSPNNLDYSRIGVSTSRRVGGAVQRNRARRVVRESISPLLGKINQSVDMVILCRKPILDLKTQDVKIALEQTLTRGKLLNNE
jgi:ribonuclease P protein component